MKRWRQMVESDNPLEKIRAKQMIELTQEGSIEKIIPELVQMVLEKLEVHDAVHISVCFLDGTKKEVLL